MSKLSISCFPQVSASLSLSLSQNFLLFPRFCPFPLPFPPFYFSLPPSFSRGVFLSLPSLGFEDEHISHGHRCGQRPRQPWLGLFGTLFRRSDFAPRWRWFVMEWGSMRVGSILGGLNHITFWFPLESEFPFGGVMFREVWRTILIFEVPPSPC